MQIDANTSLTSLVGNNSSNIKSITNYQPSKSTTISQDSIGSSLPNIISEMEKQSFSVTEKTMSRAVDKVNEQIRFLPNNKAHFELSLHEKTGKIILKIMDNKTNDVIKEIPSEKTLDMLAEDWKIEGALIDEKL